MSRLTVSGVIATRRSPGAVSRGTPTVSVLAVWPSIHPPRAQDRAARGTVPARPRRNDRRDRANRSRRRARPRSIGHTRNHGTRLAACVAARNVTRKCGGVSAQAAGQRGIAGRARGGGRGPEPAPATGRRGWARPPTSRSRRSASFSPNDLGVEGEGHHALQRDAKEAALSSWRTARTGCSSLQLYPAASAEVRRPAEESPACRYTHGRGHRRERASRPPIARSPT